MSTEIIKQPNAGYLFYKKYYKDEQIINSRYEFESTNKKILGIRIQKVESIPYPHSFKLSTSYPGFVTGVGHIHEIKDEAAKDAIIPMNNPFKIGFEFDYTAGMPVITGSSVKGVLRSAFPGTHIKNGKYKTEKKIYIKKLIKENLKINCEIDIDSLEKEIFEGLSLSGKPKSIYKRDIFFDAIPDFSKNNLLFGTDYITPHGDNPLKNPNPIMFLKVLPEVNYKFNFKLTKSEFYPELDEQKKLELFQIIIETLGLGAKTNVGYGHFEDPETKKEIIKPNSTSASKIKISKPDTVKPQPAVIRTEPQNYTGKIKVGESLEAKVVSAGKVKILLNGVEKIVDMSGNLTKEGTLVIVKINKTKGNAEISQVGLIGFVKF